MRLRMCAGRTGGGRLWPGPTDFVAGASALLSRLPALLAISKAHGEGEYETLCEASVWLGAVILLHSYS